MPSQPTESKQELKPRFRGSFTYALDEKGRVSVPSDFREVLGQGAQVVLTNFISDGARCLEGFSLAAWQEFEQKLQKKSRFDSKIQKLENFYLSRASACDLDPQGRILLPQYLRSYAGMEREVVFTASLHGFRLWDRRVWDVVFSSAEAALMQNPDLFADVDL